MENSFQTSFIPKKPMISSGAAYKSTSGSFNIFNILAVIVLVIMVAAYGGLFFYKQYISTQIEGLSSSLVKAQDNFDEKTISELNLYNKRYSVAGDILNKHVVLSPIFKLIGDLTIPTVQYTKFNQLTTSIGFNVKMSGIARDYRSVSLQSDVLNNSSFKNVIFSNITKDKSNYIIFDIEFDVDKKTIATANDIQSDKKTPVQDSITPAQNSTQTQDAIPASGNLDNLLAPTPVSPVPPVTLETNTDSTLPNTNNPQ